MNNDIFYDDGESRKAYDDRKQKESTSRQENQRNLLAIKAKIFEKNPWLADTKAGEAMPGLYYSARAGEVYRANDVYLNATRQWVQIDSELIGQTIPKNTRVAHFDIPEGYKRIPPGREINETDVKLGNIVKWVESPRRWEAVVEGSRTTLIVQKDEIIAKVVKSDEKEEESDYNAQNHGD